MNPFQTFRGGNYSFFPSQAVLGLHQMWGLAPGGEQTSPFDGIHRGLEEGLRDFLPPSPSCQFFCCGDEPGHWQLCFYCGFHVVGVPKTC